MGTVGLCSTVGYLAVHPYFNQLWGLLALALHAAVRPALHRRAQPRATASCSPCSRCSASLAYPLMLLFPAVILAGAAVWSRAREGRLPLPAASAAAARTRAGARRADRGRGGRRCPAALVVTAGGDREGRRARPTLLLSGESPRRVARRPRLLLRRPASSSASRGRSGTCSRRRGARRRGRSRLRAPAPRRPPRALGRRDRRWPWPAAVMFRAREFGEYFYFKVLGFLGPLLLTAAVVLAGLGAPRRGRAAAVAVASGRPPCSSRSSSSASRDEVAQAGRQADRSALELRDGRAGAARGATVRIDVPPGTTHLWAGVHAQRAPALDHLAAARHDLSAASPVGRKADYLLRRPARSRSAPTPSAPPVFRNDRFELYRMRPGRARPRPLVPQRMVPAADRRPPGLAARDQQQRVAQRAPRAAATRAPGRAATARAARAGGSRRQL